MGIVQKAPVQFFADAIAKFGKWHGRGLDIGCGTGRHLPLLIESFSEVHGCDASQKAIALVPAGIAARTTLTVSPFFPMPYSDGYFDFVMSSAAVYHGTPEDVKKAFAEMRRVLIRKGIAAIDLVAREILAETSIRMIGEDAFAFLEGPEADIPHVCFDEAKARQWLEGFEIISIERKNQTAVFQKSEVERILVIAEKL
jgi:SAM-dependent methyltransferase